MPVAHLGTGLNHIGRSEAPRTPLADPGGQGRREAPPLSKGRRGTRLVCVCARRQTESTFPVRWAIPIHFSCVPSINPHFPCLAKHDPHFHLFTKRDPHFHVVRGVQNVDRFFASVSHFGDPHFQF